MQKPCIDQTTHDGSDFSPPYFVTSMQGWRLEMEDAHTFEHALPSPFNSWSLFGVFDGHAGAQIAIEVSKRIVVSILSQKYIASLRENSGSSGSTYSSSNSIENCQYDKTQMIQALKDAFVELDETLKKERVESGSTATAVLITNKDYFFMNAGDARTILIRKDTNAPLGPVGSVGGVFNESSDGAPGYSASQNSQRQSSRLDSTTSENNNTDMIINNSNTNYKYKIHDTYYKAIEQKHFGDEVENNNLLERVEIDTQTDSVTNVTNSIQNNENAINSSSNSVPNSVGPNTLDNFYVYYSTVDHKPYDAPEKARIVNAGGCVQQDRVNGVLAVSRAFGDFEYKRNIDLYPHEQQVTVMPVVDVIPRHDDDSMIVLACDGIWDAISNENLCKYLCYKMLCGLSFSEICTGTLDMCLQLGSKDNMSLAVVKVGRPSTSTESRPDSTDLNLPQKDDKVIRQEAHFDQQIRNLMNHKMRTSPDALYVDRLFVDFYAEGELHKICGEDYIFTQIISAENSADGQEASTGGVVDKHRFMKSVYEEYVSKRTEGKKKDGKGDKSLKKKGSIFKRKKSSESSNNNQNSNSNDQEF